MVSQRTLPVNLSSAEIRLFEHERLKEIPAHQVLSFHDNILVTPEGVVFRNGNLVQESLYNEAHRDFFDGAYRIYYSCRGWFRQTIPGPFLVAFDEWSMGYFHWMTEFIPRLFMSRALVAECTVVLPAISNGISSRSTAHRSLIKIPAVVPRADYMTGSLAPFRLTRVYQHTARVPLKTSHLYLSSHLAPSGNYNDEVMRLIRDFYLDAYVQHRGKPNRLVYVTRQQAARRFIQNEGAIIEVLRSHGFEILALESLTFADQVQLLAETRVLVGQHGAALTNLLFMQEGTSVIELKTAGDSQNLCYFSLASAMKVNYLYQFCEGDGRTVQDADIVVDPDMLMKNILMATGLS